jgi:DNA-directed RNA polymerase subunit RPC12/RpoP
MSQKKIPNPRDYRCVSCGRLQFRAIVAYGTKIDIRCARCGKLMRIHNIEKLGVSVSMVET